MATISFSGVIVTDSVKQVNETTYFRVSESIGTKEKPQYNYFDCGCRFTEKQKEYIKPGKIVEIVGEYVTKRKETEEKTYLNSTVYCLSVKFKGDINKNKEEAGE